MAQQAVAKPEYGLDAPGIVRGFAVAGPLLLVLGVGGGVEANGDRRDDWLHRADVRVSGMRFAIFPPVRVVTGKKSVSGAR